LGREINQTNDPKRALELWKKKIGNPEIAPQAIRPIAKSIIKRDRPKAQTVIHGCLGFETHGWVRESQLSC
jgi:hypothetical protein